MKKYKAIEDSVAQAKKESYFPKKLVPNFNTLADVIDRLIVTVNKLSFFENKKREESLKENPNLELIVHWDRLSRNECEHRNALKMELNNILSEIVKTKHYETLPDNRTFASPPKSVAELLEEMCYTGPDRARKELAEAFENELIDLEVIQLRGAGCVCPKPLVGHRGTGGPPRCRLCNTEVTE